jgi:transcriptional regulator with XRE-family HTH domain
MQRKAKSELFRDNIRYLIKSRGQTQLSLCLSSGLTRSTIYKILDGRVVNVQQSTVRKISDFFGVCCSEIETIDFEEKEILDNSVSLHGNINPAAVPIIKERMLLKSLDRKIGELCVTHTLTYYFGTARGLIAVLIETAIVGMSEPGDLLIVKKGTPNPSADVLVYDPQTKRFQVMSSADIDPNHIRVIGEIIEERLNDN